MPKPAMPSAASILKKLPALCIMLLICLLFGSALLYRSPVDSESMTTVHAWTMDSEAGHKSLQLPCTMEAASVTLTAEIDAAPGDSLYLKAVYTPVKVYANDALIFEYGQEGSYPSFLLDPPTKVKLLPLPDTEQPVTLRLEYTAPTQRNTMTLHPVYLGTTDAILMHLFHSLGFSLFFSFLLIALGMLLVLIAFVLAPMKKAFVSMLWLGLFSLLIGIWFFGECNLSGLFIENATLLYLMAFMGLFTLAIPLMKFVLTLPDLHNPKPLQFMCVLLEFSVCAATVLQLTGTASFAKTMYLFHVLVPLSLCVFGGCIFYESMRCKNAAAMHFRIPVCVLALASVLEVINYYLLPDRLPISFFFQAGVVVFILLMSLQCGHFIKYSFLIYAKNGELKYELFLAKKQMELQKERYEMLAEISASIKAQRHDLHHQLAVIQNYSKNREFEKLDHYLSELTAKIPVSDEVTLCVNEAVNAIALYYYTMAKKSGIQNISVQLDIPSDTGQIPESELCVIIGNLLENAIAACMKSKEKEPFIHLQSRLQYGILTITMDNSDHTSVQNSDGSFRSLKSGGGTGLVSIRAVAQKYEGDAKFDTADGVFSSSVYLHMQDF